MKFELTKEDSYGYLKRFYFARDILSRKLRENKRRRKKLKILDVGCGTGIYLTIPLAKEFPKAEFVGFDTDIKSLNELKRIAKMNNMKNIKTTLSLNEIEGEKFDVIIISEVLEHVENPKDFLRNFLSFSNSNTLFFITIPNGYGIFEMDALFYRIKVLLFDLIKRRRKERIEIDKKNEITEKSRNNNFKHRDKNAGKLRFSATYAESEHINFFTYCGIRKLFSEVGLKVLEYRGRTFACGPFISRYINRSYLLIKINSYLGDKLPPYFVADWMFLLKPDECGNIKKQLRCCFYGSKVHLLYTTLKRFINKKFLMIEHV